MHYGGCILGLFAPPIIDYIKYYGPYIRLLFTDTYPLHKIKVTLHHIGTLIVTEQQKHKNKTIPYSKKIYTYDRLQIRGFWGLKSGSVINYRLKKE